ncbi:hypothetical protein Pla52o_32090 [Novipirellula galeiformis]|uniref:Uncharacterized protein n=1 Tax=Novipirellula galeiformis TaxID=2528004 RepID=A0A5C6CFY8_9BACT|nr:hypothetical protein Pla52o_32090 [Novipirellula galeiformis]
MSYSLVTLIENWPSTFRGRSTACIRCVSRHIREANKREGQSTLFEGWASSGQPVHPRNNIVSGTVIQSETLHAAGFRNIAKDFEVMKVQERFSFCSEGGMEIADNGIGPSNGPCITLSYGEEKRKVFVVSDRSL